MSDHGSLRPVNQGIIGNTVKRVKSVQVNFLDELSDELGPCRFDRKLVGPSVAVVSGTSILNMKRKFDMEDRPALLSS